jgi:hypothetical protein
MSDPVIEQIKRQVAEEIGLPLHFMERFLELEEGKVHYSRRHGLLDDLRRLVAHEARDHSEAEPDETETNRAE